MEDRDVDAVVRALRAAWITSGPRVAEFEAAFAARVGAAHAVSFSSGTAGLQAAVSAAGLGPGDEAVTTPLTFCATANCLLHVGAKPVFADVRDDSLTLDPEDAVRRMTSRTKAVLPVDYAGRPADLDAFMALAEKKGLTVIEDACHALGAEYHGRPVGSVSHMTVFSLHPVKHITTGEGGIVATSDDALARALRLYRNHGIDSDARRRQAEGEWRYDMVALGSNGRLTDFASALGLSQLARLDENLARRREIAAQYDEAFAGRPGLKAPATGGGVRHARHLYPLRLDLPRLRAGRDEIFRALRAENIGVNVHYIPVYEFTYYRERFGDLTGSCPKAEAAFAELLSLPMFHGMGGRDVDDVIEAVGKVIDHFRE
jgi:perosamine synthetase